MRYVTELWQWGAQHQTKLTECSLLKGEVASLQIELIDAIIKLALATQAYSPELSDVRDELDSVTKASDTIQFKVSSLVNEKRQRASEALSRLAQDKVERTWRESERERVESRHLAVMSQAEDFLLAAADAYAVRDASFEDKAER